MPSSTWRWLTSILIESGMAPARHVILRLWTRCSRMPPAAMPAAMAAQLERDLGLDHFLGADPSEVEVEDLLAEVVPLHVADQDRLGRAAHVELGEVSGRLDHPPDVVPCQRDRHDRLLVPVDHGGDPPLRANRRATRLPVPLFFSGSRGSTRTFAASDIVHSL